MAGDSKHDLNDLKHDLNSGSNVDLETRLIELIRQKPALTYKAFGEELSVSLTTIKRTFLKLQQDGRIIREGSNRKGKWILKW